MAGKKLSTAWARLLTRNLNALTRSALRAAGQAARKAAKQATKQVAKQVAQARKAPAGPGAASRKATSLKPASLKPASLKAASLKAALAKALSAKAQLAKPAATQPGRAAGPGPAAQPGWTTGLATGLTTGPATGLTTGLTTRSTTGARRSGLYRPPGIGRDERVPLLVMLHGCRQDAAGFARLTRMNAVAARERFLVLYPEQDRSANAQGCWNWFATRNGRAAAECAQVLRAKIGRAHV